MGEAARWVTTLLFAFAMILPSTLGNGGTAAGAEAGALEWTLGLGGSGLVSVAASPDGARIFTTGWEGDQLLLLGLDAATGQALWSVRDSGPGSAVGLWVAPSHDGDRVFVAGVQSAGDGTDALVAAYNAHSGAQLWRRVIDVAAEDRGLVVAPSPDGDSVLALAVLGGFSRATRIVALDAATGDQRWARVHALDGGELPLGLAVDASRTYVTGAGTRQFVLALDTASGEVEWEAGGAADVAVAWPFASARVVADGTRVYVAETLVGESGPFVSTSAYRAADGALAWRSTWDPGAGPLSAVTSVVLADEGARLVASTTRGDVLSFDTTDGALEWESGGPALLAQVVASPRAQESYVAGRGRIAALSTPDARTLWASGAPNALHWGAVVTADSARVVVAGVEGASGFVSSFATGLLPGLSLDPASQTATVGILGGAVHNISATNTGTLRGSFSVAVSGLADGWSAEVEPAGDVTLAPGETASLTLHVWAPLNGVAGSSGANVTLQHRGPPALSRVALTTTVIDLQGPVGSLDGRPLRLQSHCSMLDAMGLPPAPDPACDGTDARRPRVELPLAGFDQRDAVEFWSEYEERSFLPADGRSGAPDIAPAQSAATVRGPRDHPGVWEVGDDLPGETVHAALLARGRVAFIGALGNSHVWDPEIRTTVRSGSTSTWLFCAGHALLADGRWFAMGGTGAIGFNPFYVEGLKSVEIFDPQTEEWTFGPNMTHARWYPTGVTLGDGRVAVFTGLHSPAGGIVKPVEIYDPSTKTWTTKGEKAIPSYSKAYVLPDGNVFITAPARRSMTWDPETGLFADGALRVGGQRNGGGSVLMDSTTGRVLEFGGTGGNRSAEVYDPALAQWTWTGSLAYPRVWANAVLLPNGDVVAIGGENATTPSLPLEYYDAASGEWLVGPDPGSAFAYHSTAILLPDGSVLSVNQQERDVRIYKPWYFFAERPRIEDAPTQLRYADPFVVETPDAARVESAVLVRLGSVTHSLNTDSRLIPLSIIRMPGHPMIWLEAPSSNNIAPPGDYLLFLRDADGVPSEGRILRLGS